MKQFTPAKKGENAPEGYDASFTASTPMRDRHKTILPQENWKLENYNNNAIIGYNHYIWGDEGWFSGIGNPDSVIGKGRAYVNAEGNLQLDVKFDDVSDNKTAEKVKAKVANGFLNAVSVGFLENTEGRWLDKDGNETSSWKEYHTYEYGEVELMEVSVVNLPANPEALVMSKDAEIDDLKKQLKSLEGFKGKVKEVGEEFTKVGETFKIWDQQADVSDKLEVDFIEDQKIEEQEKLRKRKVQLRARRNSL